MKEKKEKQRDRRKRKMEKNHGITLVALVITIIVMLILVGVSITVAINGGLFGTAENAKDRTKTAVEAEQKLANGRIKIGDNFYASINDYPDNPIYTASVGDFVQYDVAYTDVYINQAYTNKNGWRILRYETEDEGETITNVEIISTGIPAMLQYQYNDTTTNKDAWWETADTTKLEAFRTDLGDYWTRDDNKTYAFSSLTGANVKAAAGMYNNFASIPFIYTDTNYNNLSNKYNIGYYNAVTKDGTSVEENTNGGNLFLTGNADKVRMLTLPEINNAIGKSAINEWNYTISDSEEPAPGLFKLDQLKKITGLSGYTYNTGYYWLASPYSSNTRSVRSVYYSGSVGNGNSNTFGVRPAVSLGSDISYKVERESENGFSYLVLSKVSAE